MIDPGAMRRLRNSTGSDNDIRDMLNEIERLTAENARLQKALTERRPMTEADPTGGISDDERQARRKAAKIDE